MEQGPLHRKSPEPTDEKPHPEEHNQELHYYYYYYYDYYHYYYYYFFCYYYYYYYCYYLQLNAVRACSALGGALHPGTRETLLARITLCIQIAFSQ